jgi:hypothetical protein
MKPKSPSVRSGLDVKLDFLLVIALATLASWVVALFQRV